MAEIRWTFEAETWLTDIYDYISQDNPSAAARVIEGIYQKAQMLKQFPDIGYKYRSVDEGEIRILLYGHYRNPARIGPLPAGIKLTPLWNLWRCSQLILHLPMKVSCIIMVPIAARIEGKRGERTGMIRVSGYKRQKASAMQVPHGPA